MAFTEEQTRALAAKLPEKNVKSRVHNGETRHYIEGWHAIAEANRIFGFDAWDRQTLELRCLGQHTCDHRFCVSYLARVRVTVRAGSLAIVREGAGTGHGRQLVAGEAHETAMKSAETDAMKRALATFGNPFGLALYDSEQRGVRQARKPTRTEPAKGQDETPWMLVSAQGEKVAAWPNPTDFCSALKSALTTAADPEVLGKLWQENAVTIERLRLVQPDLTTKRGAHYVDLLAALYRERKEELARRARPASLAVDDEQAVPRLRDKDHLRRVAAEPCLVCGRQPAEAHHLRFAQPRAMSRKAGDQFTVPLCRLHHQELHYQGDEEAWWQSRKVDPLPEAQRLWAQSHPVATAS